MVFLNHMHIDCVNICALTKYNHTHLCVYVHQAVDHQMYDRWVLLMNKRLWDDKGKGTSNGLSLVCYF